MFLFIIESIALVTIFAVIYASLTIFALFIGT